VIGMAKILFTKIENSDQKLSFEAMLKFRIATALNHYLRFS